MEFFKMFSFPGLAHPAPVADLPIVFSDLDAGLAGRPPRLGEHTDEVLKALSYDEAGRQALGDGGVI
jgi:crotonobetainyl-CoA:carnitine CoA-transferase CaiB-like acyl-CoA transferase